MYGPSPDNPSISAAIWALVVLGLLTLLFYWLERR